MPHISDYSLYALESRLEDTVTDVGGLDEDIPVQHSSVSEIQDYDRQDYSYGVTCIKYKRVMKPSFHLLSAVGTLGLSLPFTLLADTYARLKYHTHYFDTESGQLLGDTENEAAETANTKGVALADIGDFAGAKKFFNEAYNVCEQDYTNESKFLNNYKATDIVANVHDLLDKGEFEEAREKFAEAYRKANNKEIYYKFANSRDALDIAIKGLNHLNNGQFEDAKDKFQEAFTKSNLKEVYNKFANCRDSIKTASIALKRLKERKFDESIVKFQEAYDQSKTNSIKKCFAKYQTSIKTIINAKKLIHENELNEAEKNLLSVLKKSNLREITEIITDELRIIAKKREKIDKANELYHEGKMLWNEAWYFENNQNEKTAQRGFQAAKDKFESAYNTVKNQEYKRWIAIVGLKIDGNESFNRGVKLQEQGNRLKEQGLYQEACNKYEEAISYFQQGFNLSGDQRFNLCIELIQDCLNETRMVLSNVTVDPNITGNFDSNYYFTNNSSDDNVQEMIPEHQSRIRLASGAFCF